MDSSLSGSVPCAPACKAIAEKASSAAAAIFDVRILKLIMLSFSLDLYVGPQFANANEAGRSI